VTEKKRRSVPDRARKRAIRLHAAQTGVRYSVAAHMLEHGGAEPTARRGQTVYPASTDEHRQWLIALWQQRRYEQRVRDARQACLVPLGRAEYLTRRFPQTRGEPGTGVGPLYHGESRSAAIAMLYAAVLQEQPGSRPQAGELAWLAELGEDCAVDVAWAALDRGARLFLEQDRWRMWTRIEATLAAGRGSGDPWIREAARILMLELRALSIVSSVDGARHTLDAVLVAGHGGHAPGTRVRMLARPHRGRTATIVGVHWETTGSALAYDVWPDGADGPAVADPGQLTLLDGGSADPAEGTSLAVPQKS
jgi:hypothetical protein